MFNATIFEIIYLTNYACKVRRKAYFINILIVESILFIGKTSAFSEQANALFDNIEPFIITTMLKTKKNILEKSKSKTPF